MRIGMVPIRLAPRTRWGRFTHEPVDGTRFLIDEFGDPPDNREASVFLWCCLAMADSFWMSRASELRTQEYWRTVSAIVSKALPSAGSVLVTSEDIVALADVMASFWGCGGGRWVFADASASENEMAEPYATPYSTGKCRRWMDAFAFSHRFAGLSYDDNIIEVVCRMPCAEVQQRIEARVLPVAGIPIEAEVIEQ